MKNGKEDYIVIVFSLVSIVLSFLSLMILVLRP